METTSTADHAGPAVASAAATKTETKKVFVQGVDSKVIGNSAIVNGRKTIFFSKEEDDYMAAPFQFSLVGKFSHGYPTMTQLRAKFAALGLNKGFKIGVLDHKHIWIRLFDANDYARVWMKQTWYFDGFRMRVLKWTSNFDPNEESPIMPIWIKVFGLRPHWFHRQFLYHVASLIGKPLKLDEATTEIDNPMVARMCVELDVLERLQPDIPIQIDGKTHYFKVQYEGIPEYCKICHHRGHSMVACYLRKEEEVVISQNTGKSKDVRDGEDLRGLLDKKQGKRLITGTGSGDVYTAMPPKGTNTDVNTIPTMNDGSKNIGLVDLTNKHIHGESSHTRKDSHADLRMVEKSPIRMLLKRPISDTGTDIQEIKKSGLELSKTNFEGNSNEEGQESPITSSDNQDEQESEHDGDKSEIEQDPSYDVVLMLVGTEAMAPNLGGGNINMDDLETGGDMIDSEEEDTSEEVHLTSNAASHHHFPLLPVACCQPYTIFLHHLNASLPRQQLLMFLNPPPTTFVDASPCPTQPTLHPSSSANRLFLPSPYANRLRLLKIVKNNYCVFFFSFGSG
ncbi:hypothetical protein BUALT_Bualt06G0082700 [Buddleja alternifolia]|uniref:DUF4283 domain-containing protein n=1 Tax=Buddleja alternifolia TaxID=168488 RepID=A0AAV6XPS8_9LAMI|nr:hypothetical protein BUALT_Bualt06G0082700 [Buddleja alternifolia]